MKICEIFYSLQGEGRWTGLPNIFFRTTGCNLRCDYCDTKYAYSQGKELSFNEIFEKIQQYKCKKICLTGGEPLLQKDSNQLIDLLIQKNYQISLETNGSINIEQLRNNKNLLISLDIKCPSSNMKDKMIFENIDFLECKDQLKFVIKNREDFLYSKKIIDDFKPKCPVFFQPLWGSNYKRLARWILDENLCVRLGLQIHKIIENIK